MAKFSGGRSSGGGANGKHVVLTRPRIFGIILRLLSIRKLKGNFPSNGGGVLAGGGPERAILRSQSMGPLKNETTMQESACGRPKIRSFLYFSIITVIGVPVFVVRLLKTT